MDIKQLSGKVKNVLKNYKYVVVILLIGLVFLVLPERSVKKTDVSDLSMQNIQGLDVEALAEILQSIQGAGKVEVLLSMASGEKTVYQTDTDTSQDGDGNSTKIQTVILTDSQRSESGLITQVIPPTYLGAVVVCQGADSPTVKLAVTQAIAKITGLGTDRICVLKMK